MHGREFLPGQLNKTGSPEIPQRVGVPSANESGARPNIQIFPPVESLPQTFGRLNCGGEMQSSECPVGRRRKIRGRQKGGKKGENEFSGIRILQILHIFISYISLKLKPLFVGDFNIKRCELTCPRPLSALQM